MKIKYLALPVCLLFINILSSAQTSGCTDPLANNFNSSATQNDGSCTYNQALVTPISSFNLAGNLTETSGLISWNNQIWTHNDSDDLNIYALDTSNGNILQTYSLQGVTNTDWEEISQDEDFIYIGDFGNNANGNRTDLKILKISKVSILNGSPVIETINFSYSNQTDFSPTSSNNTDFDCEAFIVASDSIFLFTKQWISNKTSVYSIPKSPGIYVAKLKLTYDVQGLVTGATYLESKNLIALCGYTNQLSPFLYLLYDFSGFDFFGANKRKINISLPFHQVEGIATTGGLKYYLSNENFSKPPFITVPQQLHILDLNDLLGGYLGNLYNFNETQAINNMTVFPNPATDFINFKTNRIDLPSNYRIFNQSGQTVIAGKLTIKNQTINISGLSSGVYILKFNDDKMQSYKVIKR